MLLGTDISGVQASVVKDPNGDKTDQVLVNRPYPTKYLVAAGAPAFDPRCNSSNIDTALAAGCSVIGTFFESW